MESQAKACLFLPIEIKARELTAKMAFSCLAASRGHRVLIGRSGAMLRLAKYFREGVYLEKNITPPRLPHLKALRRCGHKVLAWDEESVALISYDWYLTKNIHADTLASVDAFLTLGDVEQRAIAGRYPGISDIRSTGNLRFDLLRPELRGLMQLESRHYRAQLGPYILINTNFSRTNGYVANVDNYIEGARRMFRYSDASVEFLRKWIAYSSGLYEQFRRLVPVLSQGLPGHTIVIRPHPSERADTWEQLAATLPNVVVRTDGSAVGWIDGADAIVHNGCTTGVEAFALGRLPIAFQPVESDIYDIPLPNEVSVTAQTFDEVVDQCRAAAGRDRDADEASEAYKLRRKHARQFISGLEGETASERILRAADAHRPEQTKRNDRVTAFKIIEGAKLKHSFLSSRARELARDTVIKMKGGTPRAPVRSKFGELTEEELHALKDDIALVAPDREKVVIRPIAFSCFLLETA